MQFVLFRGQAHDPRNTLNITKHDAFRAVWCDFVNRVFLLKQRKLSPQHQRQHKTKDTGAHQHPERIRPVAQENYDNHDGHRRADKTVNT